MFSSILCPVDFSDGSARAVDYAVALAAHAHGDLVLLHVGDPVLAEAAAGAFGPSFVRDEAQRELRALAGRITATLGAAAPPLALRVCLGDPATEIVRVAGDLERDAIVMGTQGLSGYRKLFFGSVTEHVLRRSSIPVLAVPMPRTTTSTPAVVGSRVTFDRILAPIDFSDASVHAAGEACELAASYRVPLLLLHVVPPVHAVGRSQAPIDACRETALAHARNRLAAVAEDLVGRCAIETRVVSGTPAEEIAAVAESPHVGLVVMGLTGTGGARPGGIAYRVLCLAPTPVLAIPPQARADVPASVLAAYRPDSE